MLERVCNVAQMVKGFEGAHGLLSDMLPLKMTMRQVYEQALRVGADLVKRRDEDVRRMLDGQIPAGPPDAPDLLVLSPDGGRCQDRARAVGDRWCEYKAVVIYDVTRPTEVREGASRDPQRFAHWKYRASKDGFARDERGTKKYCDPPPCTKTIAATTKTIEQFPDYVELEAHRRGLMTAHTVAVVGDGGGWIWRVAEEVTEARRARGRRVFEVLDIIHAGSHLCDAAKAAFGVTREGADWLNARGGELWAGKRDELIAALEAAAATLGPRPERAQGDTPPSPERTNDPVRILWNARDYFDSHRERIRYDVFRRHGLPLTSSHIESGIKQTNYRIKGSEKQWYLNHAEEMLALRCHALSADERWDNHFAALRAGDIRLPTQGRVRRPASTPASLKPRTARKRKKKAA